MPGSMSLGLLVLGGVLILIGFLGGNFKLFGAEVAATISSRWLRFIAIIFGVVLLIAASLPSNQSVTGSPQTGSQSSPSDSSSSQQFLRGTVASVVNGDLMCYITIDTENGRFSDLGAGFDLCKQEWVGQKVSVSVKPTRVNNCQSAEPCGKTKDIFLITSMSKIN
jgi:hypothetical protein